MQGGEGGRLKPGIAKEGGREIGDVETDRSKFRKEAGTDLGEPGTEPNNVYNTRIQCPAVFTCICTAVACCSGGGTVPCSALLNEPQKPQTILGELSA